VIGWRRWLWCLVTISLVCWAALTAVKATLHVTHGLKGEYFETIAPSGQPVLSAIDEEISTERVTRAWFGSVLQAFSVRWTGYLAIDENATYTFALTSDDGSTLWIDGRILVDNGGRHSAITRSERVRLDRGLHPLMLEYFQAGGPYAIALSWERESGPAAAPIPPWRLSPDRIPLWKLKTARALDALGWTVATLCAALILGLMIAHWWPLFRPGERLRLRPPRPALRALMFFIAMTAVETWPLVTNPARLSRNDNSDTLLNEWALAWVVHQAPRAPLRLYDGNIFYPERDTLAYSEPLIVQSALATPVFWLGGSPVLAYNLVLLAGFALTGWTMSLVISRWTGDWVAGLISGTLFAFNAHTLTRLPHLQAQHVEFLPLALLALDEGLRAPGVRHALWLALWFTLQALTSVYLLVMTAVALAAAAIVRPEDWAGRQFVRVAGGLALAAVMAGLALFPFLVPYWRLWLQGYARSIEAAATFSAVWGDYLTTPGRVHYALWSHRWFSATALFPGALALTLAMVAALRGVAFTDRRARMAVAFGVAGVVLSFGTRVPGYSLLYRAVPLLQAMRVVSRFGYLEIVAVAIIAGFGAASIRRTLRPAWRRALSTGALAVAVLEPLAAPIEFVEFAGISPIYERLAAAPDAVVVEIPFYRPNIAFGNAKYMLQSTRHWKPMLNGYSGFLPASYVRHFDALSGFPDGNAIVGLRTEGVTYVFVHIDEISPAALEQLGHTPALRKVAFDGLTALYALDR
jgi:hypothetical protein